MRLVAFRAMVDRMVGEIPPEFLAGVAEVHVAPEAVPHPTRAEIYTLGECIPIPAPEGEPLGGVQSRVVLYHGSFEALARLGPGFDWRTEAWETLTHELRHHLEWRASVPDLEAFDAAAEQNFARQEGEAFDPLFFLDGEQVAPGVYQVDDDWFIDQTVPRPPGELRFAWHGVRYRAALPKDLTLPAFLWVAAGVAEPPPGELVVVLRKKPSLMDLVRAPAPPFRAEVEALPVAPG